MNFSQNPLLWKNMALFDPMGKADRVAFGLFQRDLGDFCNTVQLQLTQLGDATFLAGILNPSGALTIGALKTIHTNLGSVSTNQSVACDGAAFVNVLLTYTAALTLTLTHLSVGASVTVTAFNSTAGALVFKLAATNPAGTAYGTVQAMTSADAILDLTATGVSIGASGQRTMTGGTVDTNRLQTVML